MFDRINRDLTVLIHETRPLSRPARRVPRKTAFELPALAGAIRNGLARAGFVFADRSARGPRAEYGRGRFHSERTRWLGRRGAEVG